jgi:hypothetical protein
LGILYSGFKRTHVLGWRPWQDLLKDDLCWRRDGFSEHLWLPYSGSMDATDTVATRLEAIGKRAHAVGCCTVEVIHCVMPRYSKRRTNPFYKNGIVWSLDKRERLE